MEPDSSVFILIQREVVWYHSMVYRSNIIPVLCQRMENMFDLLHMLMRVREIRNDPPVRSTWLRSISALPANKKPFRIFCFLYCSPRTTDALLVRHCAPFVNRNDFSPDFLENLEVHEIERILSPLGLQQKRAVSLKKLANHIKYQFGGEVPDNLKDLKKIKGVGDKIGLLTLQYAHGKVNVSDYILCCFFTFFMIMTNTGFQYNVVKRVFR